MEFLVFCLINHLIFRTYREIVDIITKEEDAIENQPIKIKKQNFK